MLDITIFSPIFTRLLLNVWVDQFLTNFQTFQKMNKYFYLMEKFNQIDEVPMGSPRRSYP